jgi:hypothetical protein
MADRKMQNANWVVSQKSVTPVKTGVEIMIELLNLAPSGTGFRLSPE